MIYVETVERILSILSMDKTREEKRVLLIETILKLIDNERVVGVSGFQLTDSIFINYNDKPTVFVEGSDDFIIRDFIIDNEIEYDDMTVLISSVLEYCDNIIENRKKSYVQAIG